jgi:hypothetical protein
VKESITKMSKDSESNIDITANNCTHGTKAKFKDNYFTVITRNVRNRNLACINIA